MQKEHGKFREEKISTRVIVPLEAKFDFVPWTKGEAGQQSFIKLKKKDEQALLYLGRGPAIQAEFQKILMRLLNDGWVREGDLDLHFDGRAEPEVDALFQRDTVTLEIGQKLLALVDTHVGAPLLGSLGALRSEVAQDIGFIVPGVNIKDNLKLNPNAYVIKIRESPVAMGEIFLDRLLAVGSLEALGAFEGWSTTDPSYRLPAKWIEPKDREKAEKMHCFVLGSLNVLVTHLRETMKSNAASLLGLQETRFILERMFLTHPAVAEEFLTDTKKLRRLRKVLQNLLSEKVSIRDLITIVETVGDCMEDLDRIDIVTEMVRLAIARQICWMYLNEEGKIRALALSEEMEERLIKAIQETPKGMVLTINRDEGEDILVAIKRAVEEHGTALIITQPPTRIFLRRLIERAMPAVGVISVAELVPGIKVEVVGQVKKGAAPVDTVEHARKEPTPSAEDRKMLWRKKK
jgi:flagellar biosynthesis protein FlhA